MTCPGSRALTHSNPHVTGVARSAFTGPKHYQSIVSSTSPGSLRDKMASIQQLSVSALFYSLKCKSSQADPATVIQFITSTAPITCGCFTSTCTHQRPQVEWKQKAFLTYRPHWNPPLFRGCVSQIFLWRNPIMSLNRVSNLQYTWTIPSFNLKQNFGTVQRATVTSNSHQPLAQEVGIWWEVQTE